MGPQPAICGPQPAIRVWPATRSPKSVAHSPQPECGPQPAICDLQPTARNAICGPQPAARNLATLNLCFQFVSFCPILVQPTEFPQVQFNKSNDVITSKE